MKTYPPNFVDGHWNRYITVIWRGSRVPYSDNIITNYKITLSLHVLERLSDEYNFWLLFGFFLCYHVVM